MSLEETGVTPVVLAPAQALHARGLTSAEVAERVAAGRTNDVPDRAGRSVRDIVRANVLTRINAILGVLWAIVLTTGEYLDGAFGLLIIANSGIGIVQEVRAKRTLDALTIVGQARPQVRRDGAVRELAPKEVVLDDVIEMGPGDQVVVDGEVIEGGAHLEVDESLLTGEADPVMKHPGDLVLSGSFVVAGSGAYRATRVGADAYAARLAEEASKFTLTASELRSGIDQILKIITYLLVPAGLLIIWNQLNQEDEEFNDALRGMVAALVPMVPEGLVLLTSIAFAVGVVRLGKRQCLVQELPAIEGLARVDVVCADKTGTLTENGMRLAEVRSLDGGTFDAVLAALAASDPRPNASVLALAEAHPVSPGWRESANAPFSSARKWSGSSFEGHGDWVLGAPDVLLDPASPVARAAEELGAGGLRVLLLGESDRPVDAPDAPGEVSPRALVVLEQRVRADARPTLEYFAAQDVAVKVISGDNAVSVGAVAGALGLVGDPVDARSLSEDPAELAPVLRESTTFGRVTPAQKRAMVTALQQDGHTVAMTGDGVNDVLALKDADIGVAMGAGSPATRAVAQIVLLDNRFATLPYVVAEGRRVIGNIERVSNLFLTKTVYSVFLAVAIGLAQVPYPFIPRHVTFAAWFTTGLPAFVLSFTPNQDRARSGFVPRVLRLAVPAGLTIGICTFTSYLLVREDDATDVERVQASTTALITLIVIALWVLAIIARPYVWWKVLLIVGSAGAYLAMFMIPATQDLLELDPSDTGSTTTALVIGAIGIVVVEIAWWVDGALTGEPRALTGRG